MTATLKRPAVTPPASEPNAAPRFENTIARKSSRAYIALFVATLLLTPLLILVGADQGYGTVLAALAALVVLALVPWKPILSYLTSYLRARGGAGASSGTPIGTDRLDIFFWPARLQGLPERPIGFFILAILVIIVVLGSYSAGAHCMEASSSIHLSFFLAVSPWECCTAWLPAELPNHRA